MISLTHKASRPAVNHLLLALSLASPRALLAQEPLQPAPKPSTTIRTPAPPPARTGPIINRNLIVLDPAHGGPETGGKFTDQTIEKDVTLALASRLRPALTAAGFTVVSTRDADLEAALTTDQRAEFSNRQHAAACLILHATATGSGVHLYISGVPPTPPPADLEPDTKPAFEPILWDMAQASTVTQSLHLQTLLFSTLNGAGLAALRGRGPVPPLDNLTCPAVAIELAPLAPGGGARTPVTDASYQQRLAQTITAALQRWRDSLPVRQKVPPAAPPVHPPAPAGGPQ